MNTKKAEHTPGPMKDARIILIDGKKFYLRIKRDSKRFIFGTQVDKNGDDSRIGKPGVMFHLIEKCQIKNIRPMVMNLKYAELENIK